MPSPHQKYIDKVTAKLAAKADKAGVNAKKYQGDLDRAMSDPAITRLFELADLKDEVARVEGSDRLKLTLATVAALAEHFRTLPEAPVDPVLDRVEAAVNYALTGQMLTS